MDKHTHQRHIFTRTTIIWAAIATLAVFGIATLFAGGSSEPDESGPAMELAMASAMEGGMGDEMPKSEPVPPPEVSADEYTKPPRTELRDLLTPIQFNITQQDATEPAFNNEYWANAREGIYVDVVSGEPLFSSLDKFKSGTGWPSFTRPLEPGNVVELEDRKFGMVRTEVRSHFADSHLGHVFNDGPGPTGLRYCMNSAAMRFVPVEDLEEEGYGSYLPLFGNE